MIQEIVDSNFDLYKRITAPFEATVRITDAGVTAGRYFGLALIEYAEPVPLLAEYNPAPPFDAGIPSKAGPEVTKLFTVMFVGFVAEARAVAEKTAAA